MAAVEHQHAAAVALGGMVYAVEERLVAVGAAQFYAHGVAHMAGEGGEVCPVALGGGAQPHDVVARHTAVGGYIVDKGVVLVAVGRVEGDAVEPRGEVGDVYLAGFGGLVEACGDDRPGVLVALLAAKGTIGEEVLKLLACAHPVGVGVLLHQGVEGADGVGLPQLLQHHAHSSLQRLVVEIVVGKGEVAEVVAGGHAVAVGVRHMEREVLLVHLPVSIDGADIGGVDAGCFSSISSRTSTTSITNDASVSSWGEGELEVPLFVDREAVAEGEVVGNGVGLQGVGQGLATHLPFDACAGHGGTAVACHIAVERHGLAEAANGGRVGAVLGGGER